MKEMPKVGVIILTHNSGAYIEDCLKNVLNNEHSNIECIIVDNNSTDQTIHIVKKKYPKLKLINNKSNLGYGAGNNVGIRYLLKNNNISYILILNPDTLVSPNLISECVRVLIHENTIGIVGPIITYAQDPNKIWFAGGYLNRLFLYTKHRYMNKDLNYLKSQGVLASTPLRCTPLDTSVTDFITGACMMIKKEVFKKIGFLPEEYFMYFEDVDFCQKAIKSGYTCQLLPKSLVKHYVSASTGHPGSNDLTPFRAYYYARNPFIYIRRNVIGIYKITNYFGQFFIRLPYYGLQMFLQRNLKAIIAYLKGLRDGVIYKI